MSLLESRRDDLVTTLDVHDAWPGPTSRDSDTRVPRSVSNLLPIPLPIDAEAARWHAYLTRLGQQEADGTISMAQRRAFLTLWERGLDRQPTLRRPTVGPSSAGHLQASWSYVDVPDRVFTIELHPDGSLEWFYRDRAQSLVLGTDDVPVAELPDEAIRLLAEGFPAPPRPR